MQSAHINCASRPGTQFNVRIFLNSDKALKTVWGYSFAVVVVGAGLGVSLLLQRATHCRILFPLFAAVIAAGWIGGKGPAWASVIMTLLVGDYFFAAPLYDLGISTRDQAFFIPFALATIMAGWCGSLRRRPESWSTRTANTSLSDGAVD